MYVLEVDNENSTEEKSHTLMTSHDSKIKVKKIQHSVRVRMNWVILFENSTYLRRRKEFYCNRIFVSMISESLIKDKIRGFRFVCSKSNFVIRCHIKDFMEALSFPLDEFFL